MRRSMLGLLATAVLLTATACEKVPKPSSDSTPPTLKWHVENRTANTTTDINGNGKVSGKKNDEFRVTLTATDPQGIHKIIMGGGYTRSCVAGDVASGADGDYAGQSQSLAPDAQGKVLTQIFLIQSITPDVTCTGNLNWTGTSIDLVGTGTNYFNGTTTGNLTITIAP